MEEVFLSEIPVDIDLHQYLKKFIKDGDFSVSFLYESSFSNTPRLRQIMEALFDIYELDPKDKNRLVLVSDELNNNAVEHGTGDCWENKASIVIRKEDAWLFVNIEVTDCWEWNAADMEWLKTEKDAIGFERHHGIRGRGLFLITEKIADKLYFKDAEWGGLIVWIEKSI